MCWNLLAGNSFLMAFFCSQQEMYIYSTESNNDDKEGKKCFQLLFHATIFKMVLWSFIYSL